MADPSTMQTHPSWFDWITVAALIIGPILALFAQRLLDWLREKKERRVSHYLTVMSLRATWLHHDSIRALNSIDTIFNKSADSPVRDAWARIIAHANTQRPDWQTSQDAARAWDDRLLDLRVDLYQLLGAAVGYDHTVDYIKTQFYQPQLHVDAELEQTLIRKQFAKVLVTTDEAKQSLKVVKPDLPQTPTSSGTRYQPSAKSK